MPTALRPVADHDPWSDVEELARGVDRQLECFRSIVASGDAALFAGPLGQYVRRSAIEVADRTASLSGATGGPAETARSLGAIANLAAWAVESSSPVYEGTLDVVVVLGDTTADRFRSLVQWAARREPSRPPSEVGLPLELYLRQLVDAPGREVATVEVWRLATTWMAIAAKIGEAASWWTNLTPNEDLDLHRESGRLDVKGRERYERGTQAHEPHRRGSGRERLVGAELR